MCDTCGCGSTDNGVSFTIPGKEPSHTHDHTHEHNHDTEILDQGQGRGGGQGSGQGHSHGHGFGHSHGHSHNHEDDHGNESYHTHEDNVEHGHQHSHDDGHKHSHEQARTVNVEVDVLSKNNLLAERNRGYFDAKQIKVLNLMSSPGSGKTTLLEKTIKLVKDQMKVAVIEGDQQTINDAQRIQKTGVPVIQVNTGNGCHLDSDMINKAVKELNPDEKSVLFIENVGNLVCPSLFDLGEDERVVIISTTEGDDKPIKYPTMFANANLCIINKTDLLPYIDFDMEACKKYALQVNHHLKFIELSAKTEEGMQAWIDWIKEI